MNTYKEPTPPDWAKGFEREAGELENRWKQKSDLILKVEAK